MMVIDQGNFHIVDNDLKFTITWKLLILWVSAKSHLDQSTDFISGHRFLNCTYSQSSQNFGEIKPLSRKYYIKEFMYLEGFLKL